MKSNIHILADYHNAPFERNVTVRCPEEYIQAQMRHLTRKYKRIEPVLKIEKGDVVILALQSELEKFNRPSVPATVGSGLFDAELEMQLCGHCMGETFIAAVQDKPVTVTVKQVSRTCFPEPTDEMAAAYSKTHEEFDGICTVSAYRNYVVEKYMDDIKQKVIDQAVDEICDYVLTNSDWNFDEDELHEFMETAREEIIQDLKEEGKTLHNLSLDELRMYFDISSMDEFDEMLKSSAEQSIAADLWLMAVHKKDSVELIDEYPWGFLEDFVRKNLTITEEK